MTPDMTDVSLIAPAFLAGMLILATHVPLGRQMLGRGIVFLDLAVAQLAALGVIAAHFAGFESGWMVQLFAVTTAVAGAILLHLAEKRWPQTQEALIGSVFAVAACLGILLLAHDPHGGEALHDLLAGQILWVGSQQLQAAAVATAALAALLVTSFGRSGFGFYLLFACAIAYGLPITLFLTWLSWRVLVRVFMKNPQALSVDDSASARPVITREFRATRLTVMVILVITLVLWFTSPIHHLGAAAVSAIPLVFLPMTRILKGEDVRAIGWDTLLLLAGGIALGTALTQTGLLDLYAGRIASLQVPNIVFFVVLAYMTMLFSNVMSNTATSTVLIPLGMAILPGKSLEVCMIIGLSASTALFLPVSTPPNAIAYSTGLIEQKDFRLGGLLVGLLGPALIIGWVLFIGSLKG